MFDSARVRSTLFTEAAGYAGAEGTIFGVTTVSVTGVEVIGEPEDDTAINVDFDGRLPAAWFQPSLIEVTGQPEATIEIGPARLHRSADRAWHEVSVESQEHNNRPWWRFW